MPDVVVPAGRAVAAPATAWLGRLLPRWSMAGPALIWWCVFFVVPIGWIAIYSLGAKPPPGAGAVTLEVLSLDNYANATSGVFLVVFWITMRTAVIGTIACALVGFPVAYALANLVAPKWRSVLLFLLVLPYWTSFLLRTFAWRIVLAPEGVLSGLLQSAGLIDGPLALLDTNVAVQLGIIYNYLPLMILPMYVALERIDPAMIRASMDLGAGPVRTFLSVTVPLAAPGIFGGLLLTFILAAGDYVVPAILGGAKGLMIGNLVATQILAAQNLPLGAGMAIVLIGMLALVVLSVAVVLLLARNVLRLARGPAI